MNKIKLAALKYFEAVRARAEANLELYLERSVGIGEHPDVVEEVIKLTKEIVEAEEAIRYLYGTSEDK
jgi:hypothetical protein